MTIGIQDAIKAVSERRDLYADEMVSVMRAIMTGETTDAQIGALLMGVADERRNHR